MEVSEQTDRTGNENAYEDDFSLSFRYEEGEEVERGRNSMQVDPPFSFPSSSSSSSTSSTFCSPPLPVGTNMEVSESELPELLRVDELRERPPDAGISSIVAPLVMEMVEPPSTSSSSASSTFIPTLSEELRGTKRTHGEMGLGFEGPAPLLDPTPISLSPSPSSPSHSSVFSYSSSSSSPSSLLLPSGGAGTKRGSLFDPTPLVLTDDAMRVVVEEKKEDLKKESEEKEMKEGMEKKEGEGGGEQRPSKRPRLVRDIQVLFSPYPLLPPSLPPSLFVCISGPF